MSHKLISSINELPDILKHHSWDAVISLGGTCQVAFQLKRLKLRSFSGPFDWLFSLEAPMVSKALESDFDGWLLKDNLHEEASQTECRRIVDDKYSMIHQHIFPADKSFEEAYDEVKDTVDRRIGRLLSLKDKGDKDILFVRTNTNPEEAKVMGEVIRKKYGPNSYLLVINHIKEHEVRMLPQISDNVLCFELFDENENTGQRWQGFDAHWDIVFANVALKGNDALELDKDVLFDGCYSYEQDAEGNGFRWTMREATVNVTRFAGKTISLSLKGFGNNKLYITDDSGRRLHSCTFGKVSYLEYLRSHQRYVGERVFDISLNPEVTTLHFRLRDEAGEVPGDPRKFGVCIYGISAKA